MGEIEICVHGAWIHNCRPCREKRKMSVPAYKGTSKSGRKTPENSDTYYGHPWPEWFDMRNAGIAILRECGERRHLITYPDLWVAINERLDKHLDSSQRKVSALLNWIDQDSGIDARFMLTALVIDGHTDIPSEGFFRLAERKHLLSASDSPPAGQAGRRELSPAQRRFWDEQKNGVFEILSSS